MLRRSSRVLAGLYVALATAFWLVFAFDGRAVNLGLGIVWTLVAVGWIGFAVRSPMTDVPTGTSIGRRTLIYLGVVRGARPTPSASGRPSTRGRRRMGPDQ